MISKNEFIILREKEKNEYNYTQRLLSERLGLSLGLINKYLKQLTESGYIKDMKLTKEGYDVLEPFRVKRAIFIAAGFGSRMLPVTLNTPKPLVKVHGKRIIETMLDAVVKVGIQEIFVVRGYLGECFDVLLKKYPNIKFFDNNMFNEGNNITSAMLVKDFFANSYILDGDLVLKNDKLITKYQYANNYLGIYKEVTDDWCLMTKGANLQIDNISVGGKNCYQWVGISYWDKESGQKLSEDIPKVFGMTGGKERYWDQVALEYCKNNYKVFVRECKEEDIVEIDSFKELKEIDKSYDVYYKHFV